MEENTSIFSNKIVGILVAVVVLATVLVPICNAFSNNGGGDSPSPLADDISSDYPPVLTKFDWDSTRSVNVSLNERSMSDGEIVFLIYDSDSSDPFVMMARVYDIGWWMNFEVFGSIFGEFFGENVDNISISYNEGDGDWQLVLSYQYSTVFTTVLEPTQYSVWYLDESWGAIIQQPIISTEDPSIISTLKFGEDMELSLFMGVVVNKEGDNGTCWYDISVEITGNHIQTDVRDWGVIINDDSISYNDYDMELISLPVVSLVNGKLTVSGQGAVSYNNQTYYSSEYVIMGQAIISVDGSGKDPTVGSPYTYMAQLNELKIPRDEDTTYSVANFRGMAEGSIIIGGISPSPLLITLDRNQFDIKYNFDGVHNSLKTDEFVLHYNTNAETMIIFVGGTSYEYRISYNNASAYWTQTDDSTDYVYVDTEHIINSDPYGEAYVGVIGFENDSEGNIIPIGYITTKDNAIPMIIPTPTPGTNGGISSTLIGLIPVFVAVALLGAIVALFMRKDSLTE